MTRREAALILGVRETATAKRIKDAHRRMTRINHPDFGGSAFLTAKVNEAMHEGEGRRLTRRRRPRAGVSSEHWPPPLRPRKRVEGPSASEGLLIP